MHNVKRAAQRGSQEWLAVQPAISVKRAVNGSMASSETAAARAARPTMSTVMLRTKTQSPAATLAAAMDAQAEVAAELLKAMANAQRLRILCLLIEGERSVGEINADVALSQSALSQHLAVLRERGLVETRREAQTVYYRVADGPVHAIIETLHGLYCPGPGAGRGC